MSISELIAALERRILYLGSLRTSASEIGDIKQVDVIDAEIAETKITLNKLRSD
jgi:hypothetical protein